MKFRKNSQEFLETNSLHKFPEKSVNMVTKSYEFLRNFQRIFLRNFVGKNSAEFLRNFSKLSLKTAIPQKSLIFGTNSGEFPRNQLQEMILEKFLGNSIKKVTTVRESGEIPHFCYLGHLLDYISKISIGYL